MNESDRVLKKCLLGQPDGTRPPGRPKLRYEKLIEKDLEKYQITGWKTEVMDTSNWKQIVREAYDRQI
jgi:hypothetical protein